MPPTPVNDLTIAASRHIDPTSGATFWLLTIESRPGLYISAPTLLTAIEGASFFCPTLGPEVRLAGHN